MRCSAKRGAVELADTSRHRSHDLVRQCGHGINHADEIAVRNHERGALGVGDNGCGARTVVKKRKLADDVSSAESGDLLAIATHGCCTTEEDVGLLADLTLINDHGAGGQSYFITGLCDFLKILCGAR